MKSLFQEQGTIGKAVNMPVWACVGTAGGSN